MGVRIEVSYFSMKYRCLFLSDKKQIDLPIGWQLERTDVITPKKGKPQFMILLSKVEKKDTRIGFRLRGNGK